MVHWFNGLEVPSLNLHRRAPWLWNVFYEFGLFKSKCFAVDFGKSAALKLPGSGNRMASWKGSTCSWQFGHFRMAALLQARPASTMQVCVWGQEGGLKFYRTYNVSLVWAEEMPLNSEWVMAHKARPRQRSPLDPKTGFVSYCLSFFKFNLWH